MQITIEDFEDPIQSKYLYDFNTIIIVARDFLITSDFWHGLITLYKARRYLAGFLESSKDQLEKYRESP